MPSCGAEIFTVGELGSEGDDDDISTTMGIEISADMVIRNELETIRILQFPLSLRQDNLVQHTRSALFPNTRQARLACSQSLRQTFVETG